ncbi:hypothetical protein F5Y18DRAFT_171257 [Xylariaceae sp. FL1019]|nr:hypothetical protein F5Y18DRAFT_171257 [Xylariaceae sp. FL1019]
MADDDKMKPSSQVTEVFDKMSGFLKATHWSKPYYSSLVHNNPDLPFHLLEHVNCTYMSTPGRAPTLLALKQHAQSLAVLISLLAPSQRGGTIGASQDGEIQGDEPFAMEQAFDWLNNLQQHYTTEDKSHRMPLNALTNIIKSNSDTEGPKFHCPMDNKAIELPEKHPFQQYRPYETHMTLLMHANEILERLDHEYSAMGGILSIIPLDSENVDEQRALTQAKTTLVGQWILYTQHLVVRMHELEIAYGNCLDLLANEAVVPMQHISIHGPDGRSGREIVFPQDRWILANAGEDVFGFIHQMLDRAEAHQNSQDDVFAQQNVLGDAAFASNSDSKYRGIVKVDLKTRFYRIRNSGHGPVFVLPAFADRPNTEHTRDMENRPTVIAIPQPSIKESISAWEQKNKDCHEQVLKLTIQNSNLAGRKSELEAFNSMLQREVGRLEALIKVLSGHDRNGDPNKLQKDQWTVHLQETIDILRKNLADSEAHETDLQSSLDLFKKANLYVQNGQDPLTPMVTKIDELSKYIRKLHGDIKDQEEKYKEVEVNYNTLKLFSTEKHYQTPMPAPVSGLPKAQQNYVDNLHKLWQHEKQEREKAEKKLRYCSGGPETPQDQTPLQDQSAEIEKLKKQLQAEKMHRHKLMHDNNELRQSRSLQGYVHNFGQDTIAFGTTIDDPEKHVSVISTEYLKFLKDGKTESFAFQQSYEDSKKDQMELQSQLESSQKKTRNYQKELERVKKTKMETEAMDTTATGKIINLPKGMVLSQTSVWRDNNQQLAVINTEWYDELITQHRRQTQARSEVADLKRQIKELQKPQSVDLSTVYSKITGQKLPVDGVFETFTDRQSNLVLMTTARHDELVATEDAWTSEQELATGSANEQVLRDQAENYKKQLQVVEQQNKDLAEQLAQAEPEDVQDLRDEIANWDAKTAILQEIISKFTIQELSPSGSPVLNSPDNANPDDLQASKIADLTSKLASLQETVNDRKLSNGTITLTNRIRELEESNRNLSRQNASVHKLLEDCGKISPSPQSDLDSIELRSQLAVAQEQYETLKRNSNIGAHGEELTAQMNSAIARLGVKDVQIGEQQGTIIGLKGQLKTLLQRSAQQEREKEKEVEAIMQEVSEANDRLGAATFDLEAVKAQLIFSQRETQAARKARDAAQKTIDDLVKPYDQSDCTEIVKLGKSEIVKLRTQVADAEHHLLELWKWGTAEISRIRMAFVLQEKAHQRDRQALAELRSQSQTKALGDAKTDDDHAQLREAYRTLQEQLETERRQAVRDLRDCHATQNQLRSSLEEAATNVNNDAGNIVADLNSQLAQSEDQVDKLRDELNRGADSLIIAKEQLDTMDQEYGLCQDELRQSRSEVYRLQQLIQNLETQFENRQDATQQTTELEDRVRELDLELERVRQRYQNSNFDVIELRNQLAALTEAKEATDKQVEELKRSPQSQNDQGQHIGSEGFRLLTERVTLRENRIAELEAQEVRLREQIVEVETELGAVMVENDNRTGAGDGDGNGTASNTELTNLRNEAALWQREFQIQRNVVEAQIVRINELEADVRGRAQQIEDWQEHGRNLSTQIAQLNEQVAEIAGGNGTREELDALEQRLRECEEHRRKAVRDYDNLLKEHNNTVALLDGSEHEEEIADLRQQLKDCQEHGRELEEKVIMNPHTVNDYIISVEARRQTALQDVKRLREELKQQKRHCAAEKARLRGLLANEMDVVSQMENRLNNQRRVLEENMKGETTSEEEESSVDSVETETEDLPTFRLDVRTRTVTSVVRDEVANNNGQL